MGYKKQYKKNLQGIKLPPSIDFALLCLKIRNHLGVNQTDIAELLGVHRRTYQDWELGAEPKGQAVVNLLYLKELLEIPDEEVFFEQEREKEIA